MVNRWRNWLDVQIRTRLIVHRQTQQLFTGSPYNDDRLIGLHNAVSASDFALAPPPMDLHRSR